MERLDCHVKEYEWGKKGGDSEVARLFAAGHKHFRVDGQKPYAELWMGTHPDGPASLSRTGRAEGALTLLSRHIARSWSTSSLHPLPPPSHHSNIPKEQQLKRKTSENGVAAAARAKAHREEIHLPFIMKIMSIRHTLSLQVHPTKEQAAVLHVRDPWNYPDANHKPELAYALTRFELLCGFRPVEQIAENMRAFPQLRRVLGEDNCLRFEQQLHLSTSPDEEQLKFALKECFAHMLYLQVERPDAVVAELRSLFTSLADATDECPESLLGSPGCLRPDTVAVMWDTYGRFPTDVGCFAPLLLNHMVLEPGECCYYAAQELHAYLSGECVECVGCSNNTIRAGLTPKFIDREALVEVLNYRMTHPDYYMVPPRTLPSHPHVVEYAPEGCADFILHEIRVGQGGGGDGEPTAVDLPSLDCASIIVVVEGNAVCGAITVARGDIYYIPAGHVARLQASHLLAYRTFSHEEGPDHGSRIIPPAQAVRHRPATAAQQRKESGEDNWLVDINENKLPRDCIENRMRSNVGEVPGVLKSKLGGLGEEVIFDVESEMDGFL